MWELAKKSDQKRTFVLVDVLMLAKPPLKKGIHVEHLSASEALEQYFPFFI